MVNRQLTVLTENSAKKLAEVLSCLGSRGVDVRAHSLVDNGNGHCKLRMVVSDPDAAENALQEKQITAIINDVVIAEMEDHPGSLSRILNVIGNDDMRVEYSYTAASKKPGMAVMVFRFSDNRKAAEALKKDGLKIVRRK